MHTTGIPCKGIPGACSKQKDVLPFKILETVIIFDCGSILGHVEYDKGLGRLFVHNL